MAHSSNLVGDFAKPAIAHPRPAFAPCPILISMKSHEFSNSNVDPKPPRGNLLPTILAILAHDLRHFATFTIHTNDFQPGGSFGIGFVGEFPCEPNDIALIKIGMLWSPMRKLTSSGRTLLGVYL
jgi:hypothetical protein